MQASKEIQWKRNFAAALPIIIGFMVGCNLTALFLAPFSWLMAIQLLVWLITLFGLISIQQAQRRKRDTRLAELVRLLDTQPSVTKKSVTDFLPTDTKHSRSTTGFDPSLN